MRTRTLFTLAACLTSLGLLLASCTPAPAPTPTQKPAAAAPGSATPIAGAETTAAKPATPAAPVTTPKPAADQPRYGGILTRYQSSDPPNGDLQQETTNTAVFANRPIYSTLLRLDSEKLPKEATIIGDLAEKWESSSDGKTWTFYLRDAVKFHDGAPLTSDDVKFSFERMMSPPEGVKSPNRDLFKRIARIEAPDARTVKIELAQITPWFVQLMADNNAVVVPKHIASRDQKALLLNPVGSGPFKFKRWTRSVAFEMSKNDNYYLKGLPYLDGIRDLIIPDATTEVAAFRTGQVLMTGQGTRGVSLSESKLLEKQVPGVKIVQYISTTRQEFYMNVQKKPFDDVRVRRALVMVLDQQSAIDLGYEGSGGKGGPLPLEWALPQEQLNKLSPYRGPKDEDIAAAKKLLSEAGHPQGFSVTFTQASTAQYEEVQLAISNQLKKIGVEVKVRVLAYPVEHRAAAAKGDFEVIQLPIIKTLHDPDSYLTCYLTGGEDNFGKFSDKTIDDLYQKQASTLDFASRKKITDDIQLRIWELAPSWTVLWYQFIAAAWPHVKGWNGMAISRQNLEFDHVWLAK